MTELEERLNALGPEGPGGDWSDVLGRAERRRTMTRRRRVALAVAIMAFAAPALAVAVRGGWLVAADPGEVPEAARLELPYAFGRVLRTPDRTTHLEEPVLAPLLGYTAALAIPSPDGRSVAYHAWSGEREEGRPILRLHRISTGEDTVLESGAQSLAWRADGAHAFMKALRPTYENSPEGTLGGRFGHVVVRPSRGAAGRRWTTEPGAYVVRAWAGETVLAYNFPSYVWSGPQADRGLHALEGPGRARLLPLDDLVAVSPDGRLAAGPPRGSGDGPPAPFVEVVRVADGRVVARTKLPPGLSFVNGVGSWVGEWIVAAATRRIGAGALVFLRYVDGSLAVDGVIWLDRQTALRAGVRGFRGIGYGQPLFAGRAARSVVFRANVLVEEEQGNETMFLTCDRISKVCKKGPSLRPLTRWAVVVTNPSRPLPGA